MVVAELIPHCSGIWSGQLLEEESGRSLGEPWFADSRSELISKMSYWLPLTHLKFRDAMNPLEP